MSQNLGSRAMIGAVFAILAIIYLFLTWWKVLASGIAIIFIANNWTTLSTMVNKGMAKVEDLTKKGEEAAADKTD